MSLTVLRVANAIELGHLAPDGDARADTELAGSTCECDRADLGAGASLDSVDDKLEASVSVERDIGEPARPDANRLPTSPGDLPSPQPEFATVASVPTSDGSAGPRHVRPSDEIGSGHFEPGTGKVYDRVPHTGAETRHAQRVARVGCCVLLTALVGVACAGRASARHEVCRDDVEDPLERVVGHESSQRSRARSVGVGKTAAANPRVRLVGGPPEETDGGVLSSPLCQKERGEPVHDIYDLQRVSGPLATCCNQVRTDRVGGEQGYGSARVADSSGCSEVPVVHGPDMVLRSNCSNRELFWAWGCQSEVLDVPKDAAVSGERVSLDSGADVCPAGAACCQGREFVPHRNESGSHGRGGGHDGDGRPDDARQRRMRIALGRDGRSECSVGEQCFGSIPSAGEQRVRTSDELIQGQLTFLSAAGDLCHCGEAQYGPVVYRAGRRPRCLTADDGIFGGTSKVFQVTLDGDRGHAVSRRFPET